MCKKDAPNVGYKSIVKGNVVVLEAGVTLPEGLQVDIAPVKEPQPGSPAALLEVWGSDDVPDDAWDAVEQALEELDRTDKEPALITNDPDFGRVF
jgi:hypothetical protein